MDHIYCLQLLNCASQYYISHTPAPTVIGSRSHAATSGILAFMGTLSIKSLLIYKHLTFLLSIILLPPQEEYSYIGWITPTVISTSLLTP